MSDHRIHLGYEVGTGKPVEIPLAHTFITGQTQNSGKTTTLQAIVSRAGKPALAFVTKRGEQFTGRRIPPYLPREGEKPLAWPMVESIVASALGERKLKWERLGIINATKGAKSLRQVRDNVTRLLEKASRGNHDMYTLIGEYLDLILPEMEALQAHDRLELHDGLNVMDLTSIGEQLQGLVIRACLERINNHESGILTVLPEAWQFAPRSKAAPAKQEAINMARKGAAPGVRNYLLVDSQDISGVETVVRQACSLWIIGVQRELNELKRSLAMIPSGIKKPKPEDVSTLEIGQFWVCHGREAIKTYVQPVWLEAEAARAVAMGAPLPKQPTPAPEEVVQSRYSRGLDLMIAKVEQGVREISRRLDHVEQRVNELDNRTAHEIRLGPSAEREAEFEQQRMRTADQLVEQLRKDPEFVAARQELKTHNFANNNTDRRPGDWFRGHSPNQIILDEAATIPDDLLVPGREEENGEYDMADFEEFYQKTKERLLAEGMLGGKVEVPATRFVLKQFQTKAVERLMVDIRPLSTWQKQVLMFLIGKGTGHQKSEILKAITGKTSDQMATTYKAKYSEIDALARMGLIDERGPRFFPAIESCVKAVLAPFNPSAEDESNVCAQILLQISQEN